jgi:maleylacetoacetate isomerase
MSFKGAELQLHSFFRSTSSARVRTAANLKKIPLNFVYVNLRNGEQLDDSFRRVNPNLTVPVLTVTVRDGNSPRRFSICQSMAIMEFFEEAFPSTLPLLPPLDDPAGRAHVRDLVNIIICDIQPPTNQRILKRIQQNGGNMEQWAGKIMGEGLGAFDELARPSAGSYSYGDQLSLADVVLAPAVENAVRYGVDLDKLPTVKKVFERIRELEEFKAADWRHQADTPRE